MEKKNGKTLKKTDIEKELRTMLHAKNQADRFFIFGSYKMIHQNTLLRVYFLRFIWIIFLVVVAIVV